MKTEQIRTLWVLLLAAAPVFSQDITGLSLMETRADVTRLLGPPARVESSGDFESWQYQIGVEDRHEFSHLLLFRISTGELISVTHNLEPARPLDNLFPATETRIFHYPDAQHPQLSVRLRKLGGGRLLLAMGSGKPGSPVPQLLLIRENELPRFHGWLAEQLEGTEK